MTDRKCRTAAISMRIWRKSKLAYGIALLGVVALVATGTFAVEDSAKLSGVGLTGIFPTTPPSDLSEEEFAKLDGNWAEWSKGAASSVAEFYTKLGNSDAAGQRNALNVLKVKLDVMRRALNDSQYRSIHGPLTSLHNGLALRIEFAEAALDTLELDGTSLASGKIDSRKSELLSSISSLENYLRPIGNGFLWIPYFKVDELKNALQLDPKSVGALDAAKATQAKLQGRDYVLDNTQKEFTHRSPFEAFSTAVDRYLSVAGWNNSEESKQKLRAELKTLAESLDAYIVSGEKSSTLRHAFARVRFVSADGGDRLVSTLQKRLFNYNLRLMVTEAFLNRLMSKSNSETGAIRDCVLGASVSGCQITDTSLNVDLLPSSTSARFALRLNGNIRSNTTATTSEATVWTAGNHTFNATKEVSFDGQRFSTTPATIGVNAHNTTTGLTTKFAWMPIIRRIAHNIASQEVESKRGESEAIARNKVQEAVLPRFNSEVDSSFSTAGNRLERELFSGLRTSKLFPDTYQYQTTDQMLNVNIRVMSDDQVAADQPDSSLMAVTGATALIHESILNNAIDQIGLAGQSLTEVELRAKIEAFLSKALNRQMKFDAPPPVAQDAGEEKSVNGIIFAQDDPIRFRVQDNQLMVVIHAGFKQEGKDDIPTREITVPLTLEVAGTKIVLKRGNVVVAAAEGQGGGIAVNSVVRKKIQSLLPDRVVDGKVEFKMPDKTMVAYVSRLKLVDGWVSVEID